MRMIFDPADLTRAERLAGRGAGPICRFVHDTTIADLESLPPGFQDVVMQDYLFCGRGWRDVTTYCAQRRKASYALLQFAIWDDARLLGDENDDHDENEE